MNKENIWITGDIHSNIHRFDASVFTEQMYMSSQEDNYIIICGDAGFLWETSNNKEEERNLDILSEKPFTVLFVDGNHENFDRLDSLAVESWHGGKVHKIRKNVIHLMRGELFHIGNSTFFTYGGAYSHDIRDGILHPVLDSEKIKEWEKDAYKQFRVNHVSWWKQEQSNEPEMKHGIDTLQQNGWKTDYVITHSPSFEMIKALRWDDETNPLMEYFDTIQNKIQYRYWFCGHLHIDRKITNRDICLFEQIIQIQ